MKILVTGGCGFIGSHLCQELLGRGEDVHVLGLRCELENIKSFRSDVTFSKVDVRDYSKVASIVEKDIDAIFHLASLVNVDESRHSPMPFLETNVNGTVNLLEAARKAGIGQFIYMSTCEVYGNIPFGKADEVHPTDPRSPYAASKFAAERYALSYSHTFGANPTIKIARGFNQYGPRQSSGSSGALIPRFATALANDGPLVVFGRGDQTRDYVFVRDTVDALVRLMYADVPTGDVINIATGKEESVKEIAWSLCTLYGADPEERVQFAADRPGEILRSCGDWTKAKRVLGWSPTTQFEDGLKKTLSWFETKAG